MRFAHCLRVTSTLKGQLPTFRVRLYRRLRPLAKAAEEKGVRENLAELRTSLESQPTPAGNRMSGTVH